MSLSQWDRSGWVSLAPNGIGQVKPNHYAEILRTMWQNKTQLPYAWRILTRGVCDGCALGTTGVHDFTIEGVHLCTVRLDLLKLNTMAALDVHRLENVESLAELTTAQLRHLGRLPYPMVRRRGEPGFRRLSWDEALDLVGSRFARTDPHRMAFYLTSRGLTNEAYYVAQKAARFLGTNNVDNSSRICHSSSTAGLKQTLGVAASTCSYKDWIGTDLLVFFGSNVPNNQPVTTKYIYLAKKAGTRVVVVNPYKEPGLDRYWVPSVAESALFGTRIADAFFQVNIGGDRAFIAGVIKTMAERGWTDREFLAQHTTGFEESKSRLESYSWESLESASGTSRGEMEAFAKMLSESRSAVFVWSMGITQHVFGTDNVKAIVALALTRGFVGRDKCGLMPIRGHSGVQGGAEVGAAPNLLPGGVAVDEIGAGKVRALWNFEVPSWKGMTAVQTIEAAHQGNLDLLYQVGGNFMETLPDPDYVRRAVSNIPVRVHQDIVLTSQMMVEPNEMVVLLPAQTRYEQPGGGTETSTERRILFSPEIPGRRIGEARPEWEIPMLIAEHARPVERDKIHFENAQAIRDEIARAVPAYDGIQNLRKAGDQVQWGGPRLCERIERDGTSTVRFPIAGGLARFSVIEIESPVERDGGGDASANKFKLTTRRGKQFNSMTYRDRDPLTGARRDDVMMSEADAKRLGLDSGDEVLLRSRAGEFRGRCRVVLIAPGNIEVHWPEANGLIERGVCDPECGIPDYNTTVEILRVP